MTVIKSFLVDDEKHNRDILIALLQKHCPKIQIIGEASDAGEAYEKIKSLSPELVFLDVMMPGKSGFDLLKMFDQINFEVVFVSAFNEYAITAFDYNALGYILKPIDFDKLINTVNKAVLKIGQSGHHNHVGQFIKTLDPDSDEITKIAVHHNEDVVLVIIADIVSIQSSEAISKIVVSDGSRYYSSKDLKIFEDLLKKSDKFIRIGKNTIVNLNFLKSYQKGEVCVLQMSNGESFEVSRRKKAEVLTRIKAFLK